MLATHSYRIISELLLPKKVEDIEQVQQGFNFAMTMVLKSQREQENREP